MRTTHAILLLLGVLAVGALWWAFGPPPLRKFQSPVQTAGATGADSSATTGLPISASSPRTKPFQVQSSANSALSTNLRPILERWWEIPTWDAVKTLGKNDVDLLIQRYQQETNLLKRQAMTVALALAQDGRAVKLFENTLLHEFKRNLVWGGDLMTNEEAVLELHVWALGVLAIKYEDAYALLKQGVDPWFWKNNTQWTTDLGADMYGILAGASIVALAGTGRPEIAKLLDEFSNQTLVNSTDPDATRRDLDGAVVDAAFEYDLTQKHGVDYYKYRPQDPLMLFDEWKQTENGRRWHAWYKDRSATRAKELEKRAKEAEQP